MKGLIDLMLDHLFYMLGLVNNFVFYLCHGLQRRLMLYEHFICEVRQKSDHCYS